MGKEKKNLPKRKPIRIGTILYSDPYIYSLTICTARRRMIFSNPKYAEMAAYFIAELAEHYSMELYAYCVMPDHIHIVVQPNGTFSISRYIKTLKSKLSHLLHKSDYPGLLWQRSFYDHIVRLSEEMETVIQYVLENPVRKGIVQRFHEYLYSWDKFGIKEG